MALDRADLTVTGENILKGLTSGFVATVVLSPFLIVKKMTGLMTAEIDIIAIVTQILGASTPIVGWAAHFAIGTFAWGGLFALLEPRLPGGTRWIRGVLFGVAAWLLMMTLVMPAGGAGLFGLRLGVIAPVFTLFMHAIFGCRAGCGVRNRATAAESSAFCAWPGRARTLLPLPGHPSVAACAARLRHWHHGR